MADLLIKPSLEKTFPEQEPGGAQKRGTPRRKKLKLIPRGKRADRSRVHSPVRRRGHGVSFCLSGDHFQTGFNTPKKILCLTRKLGRQIMITKLLREGRARLETRDTPKIIPVIIIIRPQMFGAESHRKQTKGAAPFLEFTFILDPFRGPVDRPFPFGIRFPACQFTKTAHRP